MMFLQRCLDLGSRGYGFVSPDPMVGCVLVRDGRIIAEGFHRYCGGLHAEIEALRRAGRRAKGSTLYVNLEPCSHQRKNSPCAEAIIAAGVARVVVSSKNPHPLESGGTIKKLRRAGIEVSAGVLRRSSERLNERFFKFMRTGLPFVAVRITQTLDGRVTDALGNSKWITSKTSREEAHRLRSMYDAVLVGFHTINEDNPRLTVRFAEGRNPLRVVLDPGLFVSPDSAVFDTRTAGTLVFASAFAMDHRKAVLKKLSGRGVYVLGLDKSNPFDLKVVLKTLAALGVTSVLVEGGPFTSGMFLSGSMVDKVYAFVSLRLLGNGVNSLNIKPSPRLGHGVSFNEISLRPIGHDFLMEGSVAR